MYVEVGWVCAVFLIKVFFVPFGFPFPAGLDPHLMAVRLGRRSVVAAAEREVSVDFRRSWPVPAAASRPRFKQRKARRAMVHAAAQPDSCRSLLVWHTSSREARAQEHLKRSLFHAAAARGLVQGCARLLAEGFVVGLLCGREA